MAKATHWGEDIIRKVTIILVIIMTLTVALQVIMRYCFSFSLSWAEELARFLLVWISFLGIVIGYKKGQHISVDAFVSFLPIKLRYFVEIFITIISIVFWFILIIGGLYLWQSAGDQMSPALLIKMRWIYLVIPMCGVLLLCISLKHMMALFKEVINL